LVALVIILSLASVYIYTNLRSQIAILTSEKDKLQSQLDSLNETNRDYVATHSRSDLEYDSLVTNYSSLTSSYYRLEGLYRDYLAEHTHNDSEYNALNLLYQDYEATHSHNNSEYDSLAAKYSSLNVWYQNYTAGEISVFRNPTDSEVLSFMSTDKVHLNTYNNENYTTFNFAADFKNEAFQDGYKCGYVILNFPNGLCHALNCFNTADHGLIFVEPQYDRIVTIEVGQDYASANGFQEAAPNQQIVVSCAIAW
jgi:hypothetical protein